MSRTIASQNWEAISPSFSNYVDFVWKDTSTNQLIVTGAILYKLGNDSINHIAKYDGYNWSKFGKGMQSSYGKFYSATRFNNKTVFAGVFKGIDTVQSAALINWDGYRFSKFYPQPFSKINSYGLFSARNIDDTLYICGMSDSLQGQPPTGLAKLVGNTWHMVNPNIQHNAGIVDILKYQNEIYIIGQFYNGNPDDGYHGILRYKNGIWDSVGGGLKGSGATFPRCAIVYKNELYLAGRFMKGSGNAGHNIQKWNGVTWSDVGNTNDTTDGQINSMKIIDGYLYVYGAFQTVGDGSISAMSLARWDGTNWCSSKDLYQYGGTIIDVESYNNHLVIGGSFVEINGDMNLRQLARLKCDDLCSDTCNYETSPPTATDFTIYPNPSNGIFNISANGIVPNSTQINIYNTLGQIVLSTSYSSQIDISSISAGLYILNINYNSKIKAVKIIKQ
jgi:hypothetical protein